MNSYDLSSPRLIMIYERHYSLRFKKRLDSLVELFDALSRAYKPEQFGVEFTLDIGRLSEAIRCYFLDVIRYKEYNFSSISGSDPFSPDWVRDIHESNFISKNYAASLTVKWICKFHPISYRNTLLHTDFEGSTEVHIRVINEHYAILSACWIIGVELRSVNSSSYSNLLNYLRFRSFDEMAVCMLLNRNFLCSDSDL